MGILLGMTCGVFPLDTPLGLAFAAAPISSLDVSLCVHKCVNNDGKQGSSSSLGAPGPVREGAADGCSGLPKKSRGRGGEA